MLVFRRICALVLTLALVATSGAMASMRDREAGAQHLVICTGQGPQLIMLDAQGEEITPGPICPDCTIVLAAAPGQPFRLPRDLAPADAPVTKVAQAAVVAPALAQNRPRAPPVGV